MASYYRQSMLGDNNPNFGNRWGVLSTEYQKDRGSHRRKRWRAAVLDRDDYSCVVCGANDVKLYADHIKPFVAFPELRFEVSNGRTLCLPCHVQTGTYGSMYVPAIRRQVIDFLVERGYGVIIRANDLPRVMAFKNGQLLFVDVTVPGNGGTPSLKMKMEELEEHGARCIVATCIEDVEEAIGGDA